MNHSGRLGVVFYSEFLIIGWCFWEGAVFRSLRQCIEVERTTSKSWIQNLRTLPLLCLHCFEWRPKSFPKKLKGRLLSWWVVVLSFQLTLISTRTLKASVGSCHWWRASPLFGAWPVTYHFPVVRYNLLIISSSLDSTFKIDYYYAHKYQLWNFEIFKPFFTNTETDIFIPSFLLYLSLLSILLWCVSEASMASKEHKKQKKSFKNTLLIRSDVASSNETNPNGSAIKQKSASSLEDGQQNDKKESTTEAVPPTKVDKAESSKPLGKMDVSTFFNKLNKVKENFKTLQESSLFGFLIGKYHDFKKKTNKLKFDWKNMNGSVDFIERQMGWFEIRFSNPIDKKQVWEGRPYHLFNQLLLLKPWSPTFDPSTESIFLVDMWVRIPAFPPEYYNFESINTILAFNKVGTLLKLDPNALKRNWAKFARFCINLDCSKAINKEIVIPDDCGNMKKFTLWFEDIPQGCGNCGELDHNFTSCPLRKFIPSKFKITFKKPSSSCNSTQENISTDSGWKNVGKKGKEKVEVSSTTKDSKGKQVDDLGGIDVIYITDESSTESQNYHILEEEKAHLSTTETTLMGTHSNLESAQEEELSTLGDHVPMVDPNAFILPPTIGQEDVIANQHYLSEFNKERDVANAVANLFYYQEEENEDWADGQGDFLFEEHPIIDGALDDQMHTFPLPDLPKQETSFHSLSSDNSMLNHIADMELKKAGMSTSGSGKRKAQGGDGDTASSVLVGSKKPKI